MKIKPFPAYYPNFELITDPDAFFATVKFDFSEYFKKGVFFESAEPAFYICEIHTPSSVHTGFVASVDIEEYLAGKILRHENTLSATEENLTGLLVGRNAMIKPVLLAYRKSKKLSRLIEKAVRVEPFFNVYFAGDQQDHVYYRVSEKKLIAEFQKAWKEHMPVAYIADGHHRCSTSATLYQSMQKKKKGAEKYRYLLSVFFPFEELVIHEYNRIVELPKNVSLVAFLARLSELCSVKPMREAAKPGRKHEMTMFLNREWYRLRWKKKVLKKYADEEAIIDAHVLNQEVIRHILGIEDVRHDDRIHYVDGLSGIEGLTEKTEKDAYRIGFCLYPMEAEDLIAVADAGKTLPPKSTWFEPRIKNGLLSQQLG